MEKLSMISGKLFKKATKNRSEIPILFRPQRRNENQELDATGEKRFPESTHSSTTRRLLGESRAEDFASPVDRVVSEVCRVLSRSLTTLDAVN